MNKRFLFFLVFFGLGINLYVSQDKSSEMYSQAEKSLYKNPDKTLEIANKLLKEEKDPAKIANIYLLISKANIAKREFDNSLKYIVKAEDYLKETKDNEVRAKILISIAIQYQQMEFFAKSLETLQKVENICADIPDSSDNKFLILGKSFAVRGMIYKSQLNPKLALEKFLEAQKLLEKSKNTLLSLPNLSVVFYNIGYCYLDLGEQINAQKSFEKSIDIAKNTDAESLEAFAYKGLADVYIVEGKYENALVLLDKSQEKSQNIGDLVLNEGIYKGKADSYLGLQELDQYQHFYTLYKNTQFNRHQNELKSINSAIDIQYVKWNEGINKSKSTYQLSKIVIITLSVLCIGILLFLLFKKRKQNQILQEKIKGILKS